MAVIRRSKRLVILDPAVMSGDRIDYLAGDELRLMRVSAMGHLGEHADEIARCLRGSGWQVQVRDCKSLVPRIIEAPANTPAQVAAASAWAAEELARPVTPGVVTGMDGRKGRTGNYRRYRCADCGKVSLAGGLGIHQKSTGHTGREYVGGERSRMVTQGA